MARRTTFPLCHMRACLCRQRKPRVRSFMKLDLDPLQLVSQVWVRAVGGARANVRCLRRDTQSPSSCCHFARFACRLIRSNTSTLARRFFALHDVSAHMLLCGEHFATCAFHDHSVGSSYSTTSFSTAEPQVTVDTSERYWSSWEDGQWLAAQEPPGTSASQASKRKLATSMGATSLRQPQRRVGAYRPFVNARCSGAKKSRGSNCPSPTADTPSRFQRVDDTDEKSSERQAATPNVPSTSLRNPTASSAAHALRGIFPRFVHCVQATTTSPAPRASIRLSAAAAVRWPLPRSSGLCGRALQAHILVVVVVVVVAVVLVVVMVVVAVAVVVVGMVVT